MDLKYSVESLSNRNKEFRLRPAFSHGPGKKQRVLRTDRPESAQRPLIDPYFPFMKRQLKSRYVSAVEDAVSCLRWKHGPSQGSGTKLQSAQIIHGQRKYLPVLRSLPASVDLAGDSLALAANHLGEIDAAGVLNQDVESGRMIDGRQLEVRTGLPAIEHADEFLIDIDLRVIVQAVEDQVAPAAPASRRVR